MKNGISIVAGACVGLGALAGVTSARGTDGDWRELVGDGRDAASQVIQDMSLIEQGEAPGLRPSEASNLGGFAACFDPNGKHDFAAMADLQRRMYEAWLKENQSRYQTGTRWSGGSFGSTGDPITLYWSFVGDGVSISGGAGEAASASNLFAKMDALTARATWVSRFQSIFDRWSQLGGINYVRITVGGNDWDDNAAWGSNFAANQRGHVRISMHLIDGASGILAYTYFPQNGDMVFDSGDATAGNFGSSSNQHRFLRNTAAHEHGHGFGFNHVCSSDTNQLMEPFLATSFDGPRQDDIRAIQKYYGDINEPDNTAATAVFAGNLGVGTISLGTVPNPPTGTNDAVSSTLSIDANAEVDYHKITTASILLANFTLTPVGSTYDNSTQAGNGSCNSGTPFNSLTVGNLQFDLIAADGSTTLLNVNAQPAGTAETYTGALLSPAGDFYFKVSKSDAASGQVQLYKATLTGTSVPTITASDGTSSTQVTVSWTAIPNNTGYQVLRNTVNNIGTATPIVTGLGTNSYNDTTASPGVTYYYWAQAAQGTATYRTVAGPDTGFTTVPTPPGAFSLSTPADFSIDLSTTPTFTWTASSGATSYTLKLSAASDLSAPFFTQTGIASTSFVLPGSVLTDCEQFYWGVTAVNAGGNTASTPASFSGQTRIPADFDHNGFLNGDDFDGFVAAFEAGDPSADFDENTFVSGEDFDAFIEHFVAGC